MPEQVPEGLLALVCGQGLLKKDELRALGAWVATGVLQENACLVAADLSEGLNGESPQGWVLAFDEFREVRHRTRILALSERAYEFLSHARSLVGEHREQLVIAKDGAEASQCTDRVPDHEGVVRLQSLVSKVDDLLMSCRTGERDEGAHLRRGRDLHELSFESQGRRLRRGHRSRHVAVCSVLRAQGLVLTHGEPRQCRKGTGEHDECEESGGTVRGRQISAA